MGLKTDALGSMGTLRKEAFPPLGRGEVVEHTREPRARTEAVYDFTSLERRAREQGSGGGIKREGGEKESQ